VCDANSSRRRESVRRIALATPQAGPRASRPPWARSAARWMMDLCPTYVVRGERPHGDKERVLAAPRRPAVVDEMPPRFRAVVVAAAVRQLLLLPPTTIAVTAAFSVPSSPHRLQDQELQLAIVILILRRRHCCRWPAAQRLLPPSFERRLGRRRRRRRRVGRGLEERRRCCCRCCCCPRPRDSSLRIVAFPDRSSSRSSLGSGSGRPPPTQDADGDGSEEPHGAEGGREGGEAGGEILACCSTSTQLVVGDLAHSMEYLYGLRWSSCRFVSPLLLDTVTY
jgi:hypothetical protein